MAVAAASHHTGYCIFSTSRMIVSPTDIFDNGVFLEFGIPIDILPSYRGLCATVNYYLTLTVQHVAETEIMNFPLIFQGAGSPVDVYRIAHSSMVAYPASTFPVETIFSFPVMPGSGVEGNPDSHPGSSEVPNIYMIRDKQHICNLRLDSKYAIAGHSVSIALDFSEGVQQCTMVRATMIMGERRPDDSRIQDKTVAKVLRMATDAEYLTMSMSIPEEQFCSFEAPFFKVEYRIELEFCLPDGTLAANSSNEGGGGSTGSSGSAAGRTTGGPFENALSFSIPIEVLTYQQHCAVVHVRNEGGAAMTSSNNNPNEGGTGNSASPTSTKTTSRYSAGKSTQSYYSALSVQQFALQCLESSIVSLPIIS
eukprot:CAMPEP_0174970814 /NCGR_PEP_ID=MMETSP0004_2-20121128/9624_1 /TAXON_ID=420556 /ORGANISM="Ochromonas sp., Strain CCMP1393" /LENGTH=365 /DNA_ID=CAMNT_0016220651 /DNA_START=313 /DNA_END=1410 /DNA_ORIENTATION=-